MNLKEATSEAIRKRAKRGTIPSETGDDVMIYVRVSGRVADHLSAQYRDLLLDRMGSEIDHLREQLREEREVNRENRRVIAGLVQRIPAIEASPEKRESPLTAAEAPSNISTPSTEKPERPSWWRRFFFGS
jgi:hypothetical protein